MPSSTNEHNDDPLAGNGIIRGAVAGVVVLIAAGVILATTPRSEYAAAEDADDGVMRALHLADRELRMTNCVGTQARERPDESIADIAAECRSRLPEPLKK